MTATVNDVINSSSWQERKLSGDGYLQFLGSPNNNNKPNPQDLNNSNNNNFTANGTNADNGRLSGVSVLCGKYLLLPENHQTARKSVVFQQQLSAKGEVICVNIQTREQFVCKIIPRNPKGLTILAAYHRLEESSNFVNQVVEAILTPKVLYLIMPKHYGNVHSYLLMKRTLDEAEAANIFKQMVSCVQHCHSKGIVLRDIKIGRFVFVDKDKTKVKLESLEDATLLTNLADDKLDDKHGCPNYVSPEKAEHCSKNNKYHGKASDVWCLGVVLYTLLSGRYPFNDPNQNKLLNKIRSGNFIIPPGLSSSVSSLIKALLKKSPGERPTCSEILLSPWLARHCGSSRISNAESTMLINVMSTRKERECEDATVPSSSVFKSISDQVVPNF